MKMKIREIAKALQVQNDVSQWEDITVSSVSFDSRHLAPGALFIPLKGNNDGHRFVPSSFENGAAATLWAADHQPVPTDHPVLVVDDPLAALQKLSQYYVHKINPIVVAITGSNGKTTTKDLTASILATQYNVIKTHANFNNEIGVPVTLLNMNANTEVVVVEMGMDRFEQLDQLSKLANPDVAVITMIGEAHIEFFGTRDRIADAKMEITHGLKEDGVLIYNGDEPLLRERTKDLQQGTYTFGREMGNDLYATAVKVGTDKLTFTTNAWPEDEFVVPLTGEYNVSNALAALAVAAKLHVQPGNMQKGLAHPNLTANRAEWLTGAAGEKILSDVYNSNPTAARDVLETLQDVPVNEGGRRIAVLGDMLELGKASKDLHASLAEVIDPAKLQEVYLVGPEMAALRDRLTADGYPVSAIHYYGADQLAPLVTDLNHDLKADDVILLKGSHGIHLEKVLAKIMPAQPADNE